MDLPGTQHVPERRNEGSLDIYLSDVDKDSLEKFAKNHTTRAEAAEPVRRSPMRQARLRAPSVSDSEDNEMTYQGPAGDDHHKVFHTQPIDEPSGEIEESSDD